MRRRARFDAGRVTMWQLVALVAAVVGAAIPAAWLLTEDGLDLGTAAVAGVLVAPALAALLARGRRPFVVLAALAAAYYLVLGLVTLVGGGVVLLPSAAALALALASSRVR